MNGGYFGRESRTVYANELACDKSMVICIIKNSITNQMRCQAIPWFVRFVATTSQTYAIFSEVKAKSVENCLVNHQSAQKIVFYTLFPF